MESRSGSINETQLTQDEQNLKNRFDKAHESEPNIQFILEHWNRKEIRLIRPLMTWDPDSSGLAGLGTNGWLWVSWNFLELRNGHFLGLSIIFDKDLDVCL